MNKQPRIKHCATCAKEMDMDKKEFITIMHDFYKFGKK